MDAISLMLSTYVLNALWQIPLIAITAWLWSRYALLERFDLPEGRARDGHKRNVALSISSMRRGASGIINSAKANTNSRKESFNNC